ncbi:hypothetical protein ACFL2V_04085 [Pseudomonadota bacterium]
MKHAVTLRALIIVNMGRVVAACSSGGQPMGERSMQRPFPAESVVSQRISNNSDKRIQSLSVPNLSGVWVLNKEMSDDPQERVQALLAQSDSVAKGRVERRDGRTGGRRTGGERQGMKGGSAGGRKGGNGQRADKTLLVSPLLIAPKTLEIVHEEPSLVMVLEGGERRALYTDLRVAKASDNATSESVIAGWKGNVLVVESASDASSRIMTQRYKLNTSPRQLWVSTLVYIPKLSKPVLLNRVYEASSDSLQR